MIPLRLAAVALALAFSVPSAALEPSERSPSEQIPDGPLLPIISQNRLSVTVYSAERSRFAQVRFAVPLSDEVSLIHESGFVAFQTGKSLYAINAAAAKWARLDLSEDAPVRLHMNPNFLVAFDERGMFVFGRKASDWQGVHRETGEPVKAEIAAD